MSDVMLHGVLCMPPELWTNDELDKMQRYSRYLQASRHIEELTEQRDELLAAAKELVDKWGEMSGTSKAHAGGITQAVRMAREAIAKAEK